MNQPLVSIGLPAYKGAHFAEALRSIKTQTYRNIDVIVQDDASPDDLKSIFCAEVGDDSRFSYSRNEINSSPDFVKNWDVVLKKAKGKFFILASDDDLYEKSFVERLLAMTEKYKEADIFSSLYDRFDGVRTVGLVAKPSEYESQTECMYAMVVENRYPVAPNVMVRTSALREIGGFVHLPAATASDYLTWLKLARNGYVTIPEYLVHWRYDGTNITSGKSKYWDRQKYLAAVEAIPIWLQVWDSLVVSSEQERFQKERIGRFLARDYDDWMIARFVNGMTFREYCCFMRRRYSGGSVSAMRMCYCVMRRLFGM